MRFIFFYIIMLVVFWMSCERSLDGLSNYQFQEVNFSVKGMTPNFFAYGDDQLLLSWIESSADTLDKLQWTSFNGENWNQPAVIASGSDWFVNWADFPAIAQNQSFMVANWLQKSAEGTYDYDIHIALSKDKGDNWDTTFILHKDQISAEHGFVSLMPERDDAIRAVWLDGRMTKISGKENKANGTGGHDGHGGAMTLRTALINQDGSLEDEKELDNRVCDCCQTDVTVADSVVLVVYRDRSPDEIRDMGIVRRVNGVWNSPSIINEDGWQIAGCPVNGPAISAQSDGKVAVVWFTAPNNKSKVQLKISNDYGESFSEAFLLATDSTLGRVDVAWIGNDIVVSQLVSGNKSKKGFLQISILDETGHLKYEEKVAPMLPGRESGFPVLEVFQNKIWVAWTSIDATTREKEIKMGVITPL